MFWAYLGVAAVAWGGLMVFGYLRGWTGVTPGDAFIFLMLSGLVALLWLPVAGVLGALIVGGWSWQTFAPAKLRQG
ncbi:MAG: hypothetical protein ACRELD_16320, partial [Longimicrobiales bacterium]